MTRNQLAVAAQRRAFGLALESARKTARFTQIELSGSCTSTAPSLTKNRIGLLERGMARPRPIEISTLVKIFPQLAMVAPRFRPIVPGHPAGAYAPKPSMPEPELA